MTVIDLILIHTLSPRQDTTMSILSSLPPSSRDLISPVLDLEDPATGNQDTTDYIDQSNQQIQHATPFLSNRQHQRLNVKFDKNARNLAFRDDVRLFSYSVLISKDCVARQTGMRNRVIARRQRNSRIRVFLQSGWVIGIHRRYDRKIVLELFKVLVGGGACIVQRIVQTRVKRTETQFIDLVRKVEGLVIEVLAKLHVTVTTSGDVEISLDLVELEAAEDATRVGYSTSTQSRRLCKLLLLAGSTQVIMDILLLVIGTASFSSAATEVMSTFCILPVRPDGEVAGESLRSHDAVARGVLDVEVYIVALHGDDNVEVELQVVRDALFDAEGVVGFAHVPAAHLGHCQQERGQGEEERPHSSILRLCLVRGFGFGCCVSRSAWVLCRQRRPTRTKGVKGFYDRRRL
jgi:hypothetical protein